MLLVSLTTVQIYQAGPSSFDLLICMTESGNITIGRLNSSNSQFFVPYFFEFYKKNESLLLCFQINLFNTTTQKIRKKTLQTLSVKRHFNQTVIVIFCYFARKLGLRVKCTFFNKILLPFDTENTIFVDRLCVLPCVQTFHGKTAF